MRQPYELSLVERAKLLVQEIYEECCDPTDTTAPYTRIKEIILPCYNYAVRRKMSMKAAQLPHAQYTYDDTLCIYSNDQHRIMLEFPTHTNHATYITGTAAGKTVIAGFDLQAHGDTHRLAEQIIEGKIQCTGGGELRRQGTLLVYGTSTTFGTADHEQTARILTQAGLEASVIRMTNKEPLIHVRT